MREAMFLIQFYKDHFEEAVKEGSILLTLGDILSENYFNELTDGRYFELFYSRGSGPMKPVREMGQDEFKEVFKGVQCSGLSHLVKTETAGYSLFGAEVTTFIKGNSEEKVPSNLQGVIKNLKEGDVFVVNTGSKFQYLGYFHKFQLIGGGSIGLEVGNYSGHLFVPANLKSDKELHEYLSDNRESVHILFHDNVNFVRKKEPNVRGTKFAFSGSDRGKIELEGYGMRVEYIKA